MSLAPKSTVHTIVLWPFVEAIRRLGATDVVLPELAAQEGAMGARISHERARSLLARALRLTVRTDLGLLAAEAVEPGDFELVELASRAQRSVGEGLSTLMALVPILHDGLLVKLVRGTDTSVLYVALDEGLELDPAGHDFILGSLVIGARRQTRIADLSPSRVRVPYTRPDGEVSLSRLLTCPIEFDAASIEVEFPTTHLEIPLVRANESMGQLLRDAGRELLDQRADKNSLAHAVRERLRAGLAAGAVDAATLARQLHMSERTLRRRLDGEGIGLRALTDQLRHEIALERIKEPTLSTEGLATELGFTTAQAFHRAFRRWTGSTVQAFRGRGGK